jgi:phospholipase/lecithinase/hemolysin
MRLTSRFSKPTPLPVEIPPWTPSQTTRTRRSQSLRRLCLCAALLNSFTAVLAQAQDYTSIVVFGDSLSDTGNFADLTQTKYGVRIPGPDANYTDGRFTDGDETLPAARKYFGLWIEQFAAMLPAKPPIKSSLDGGTNYAYGNATNANGTSTIQFGPSNSLSVNVNNIGQQITDYLATSPEITNKSLFAVWGGSNDILAANSADDIIKAVIAQAINIQRLIDAGATQFIIPNIPPLGSTPLLNGSPKTSIPATAAAVLYNQALAAALSILRDFNFDKHLHFVQFDVFSLFNQVVASPAKYSLANVTAGAQGNALVDPDTYLFWDELHPTTSAHNILAVSAVEAVAASTCRAAICR